MKAQSKSIRFYSLTIEGAKNNFLAELTIAECTAINLVYYIQPLQGYLLTKHSKILIEISNQKPLQIVREEMETKMIEFIKKATL